MTKLEKAAMETIGKIADRAVDLYAQHDLQVNQEGLWLHVLLDLIMCHFKAQPLRLDELLAADDFDFVHDIGGITRHLDRNAAALRDCFMPRFAQRLV